MRTAEHDRALAIAERWLNAPATSDVDQDGQECVMARQLIRASERADKIKLALEKSVELQSHYAKLLNMHDGGERLSFANGDAWMIRLIGLNEI